MVDYKMVCGDLDGQLANNETFANYLLSLGINPQFQILPGVAHGGSMYIQNGTGLAFLNQHFLNERNLHHTAGVVPEPSAWVLIASASLGLIGRRRHLAVRRQPASS
jgi:hypothetical protein